MLPTQPTSCFFKAADPRGPVKKFPENLPHKLHETIGGFLSDNDQEAFRQINQHAYLVSEFITQKKLRQEASPIRREIADILKSPDLPAEERAALTSKRIIWLVEDNHLTVADARNLSPAKRQLLEQPFVQKLLEGGYAEIEDILDLNEQDLSVMNYPPVQKNILNDFLPLLEALDLTAQQLLNLNNPVIQKYIDNGKLSKADFFELNPLKIANLEFAPIQYAIDSGQFEVHQLAQETEVTLFLPMVFSINHVQVG